MVDEVATSEASEVAVTGDPNGSTAPVAPERNAMVAAAKAATAAMAKPGATAAPGGVVVPPKGAGAPAAAADDPPATALTKLERLMSERVTSRKSAEDVEARVRAKVEAEYKAKYEAETKTAAQRVRDEYAARLKADPVASIRDAGIDGVKLVTNLAELATPEGQQAHRIAQLEAKLAEMMAPLDARAKTLEEKIAAAEKERDERQQAERARGEMAATMAHFSEEKAPYTRALYPDDESVMAEARRVATAYCQASGEDVCPFADLVEYLEAKSKERVLALGPRISKFLQEPSGSVVAAKPTEQNGRTKPRTLGSQSTGERRASPKPRTEWTAADEESAMLEAARDAASAARSSRAR